MLGLMSIQSTQTRCKFETSGRFPPHTLASKRSRNPYRFQLLYLREYWMRARIEIALFPRLSTCSSWTSKRSSYSQASRMSSEQQKLQKCLGIQGFLCPCNMYIHYTPLFKSKSNHVKSQPKQKQLWSCWHVNSGLSCPAHDIATKCMCSWACVCLSLHWGLLNCVA